MFVPLCKFDTYRGSLCVRGQGICDVGYQIVEEVSGREDRPECDENSKPKLEFNKSWRLRRRSSISGSVVGGVTVRLMIVHAWAALVRWVIYNISTSPLQDRCQPNNLLS